MMNTTAPVLTPERTTITNEKSETPAKPQGRTRVQAAQARRHAVWVSMRALGLLLLGAGIGFGLSAYREHSAVASVNGAGISRADFLHRCEMAAGHGVLQQMIREELQLQFARQQGFSLSDESVEAIYKKQADQPGFAQKLQASLTTPEDIRKGIRIDRIQNGLLTRDITVTEADVQAFYRRKTDPRNPQARYYTPEAAQVAVIVSDREDAIKAALSELSAGTPFASVAAKYSKDSSKSQSGLLPAVRKGQMDKNRFPGLEDRIFAMKVNDQIEGVKVAGAWWIVRCVARSHEGVTPFDSVKDDCMEGAKLAKGIQMNGPKVQEAAQQFQKSAQIQAEDSKYTLSAQLK